MGWEDKALYQQCLLSLRDEPITLHVVPGIVGDLNTGRRLAIERGTHEWIGWVDPDDYIIPGAYTKLLTAVGDKKFAWMQETIMDCDDDMVEQGSELRITPHHIHIVHRSLIRPEHFDVRRFPDRWVRDLTNQGVYVPEVGYVWRRYNSKARQILPYY